MTAHLFRKFSHHLPPRAVKYVVNLWSPFLGAGIKLDRITPDFRHVEVTMDLKWYNTNYVGVHFGGSIYAMTDPFYMLMLLENLGPDYIVWDKSASIDFKKPGRGRIRAVFQLSETEIADIKRQADLKPKYVFTLPVDVVNDKGEVVASVKKTLYVKRKDTKKGDAGEAAPVRSKRPPSTPPKKAVSHRKPTSAR